MIIVGDENETQIDPMINHGLILITICVFIYEFLCLSGIITTHGTSDLITTHGVVNSRFIHSFGWMELSTLITSIFLHGGFLHVAWNLWYLYIFGDNIEEFFGHANYFFFYFACGVIGSLASIAVDPTSSIPSIGASGAIAGVLGAYLVLHPNAKIKTWWGDDSILFTFRTFLIPAWVAIGFWFLMNVVCLLLKVPGIGWVDHLGGFAAGMIFAVGYRNLKGGIQHLSQDYGGQSGLLAQQPAGSSSQSGSFEKLNDWTKTYDGLSMLRQPLPDSALRGAISFVMILSFVAVAGFYVFQRSIEANRYHAASTAGSIKPVDAVKVAPQPVVAPKKGTAVKHKVSRAHRKNRITAYHNSI